MKSVICLICVILYMFIGASSISNAIDSFKGEKYGWFGWHIMFALWMIALMFRIIFKCI